MPTWPFAGRARSRLLRWNSGALLSPVETAVPAVDTDDGSPQRALTDRGPVAAGDINEDGFDDLVVESQDRIYSENDLVTLLGQPDGTFAATLTSPGTGVSDGFTLADLDSDGHLDLIGNGYDLVVSHASVVVRYGIGDGSFEHQVHRLNGSLPGYLTPVIADYDGDGDADVIASQTQRWIEVYEQTSPRVFADPIDEGGSGGGSTGLAGGDFNEDGWPDVAVSRNGRIAIQLNRFGPRSNEGRPAFDIRLHRATLVGSTGRLRRTARIGGACSVRCVAKVTLRLPRKAKERVGLRNPVLATTRIHWEADYHSKSVRLRIPAVRALRSYRGPDVKVLAIARGIAQAPTAPGSLRRGSDRRKVQLRTG